MNIPLSQCKYAKPLQINRNDMCECELGLYFKPHISVCNICTSYIGPDRNVEKTISKINEVIVIKPCDSCKRKVRN